MIERVAVLMLAAGPAAALDFGQLAEVMCIAPYEAVVAPDASGLDALEPAPQFIQTGDRVYALGDAYLVLSGEFEVEASRCEVFAELDPEEAHAARQWFQNWITTGITEGRYGASDFEGDVYESTDWREPRMRVAFVVSEGIAQIVVEDTEKEA